MESDLTETSSTDGSDEYSSNYIQQNRNSTNTRLFSFLALLHAYVPDSYLPMQVCQQILGPPDPINGGPPFEERMEPFTVFISTDTPGQVCMCDQDEARKQLEILHNSGINRSTTAKKLMDFLCGGEPQPHVVQMVKDLLLKRKTGKKGKEKFSRLISDILKRENFFHAVSVLKTASTRFRIAIYPQTIARLYYIERRKYEMAAAWAKTAINIDPYNSYVADTLGQVYKNRLKNAWQIGDVWEYANKSLRAFEAVEEKAMKEEDSQNVDPDVAVRTSVSFNNRGHFGFIQVANLVFVKLRESPFREKLRRDVEDKFEFFELYLTYSMPDMKTLEPHYFREDIAACYQRYTGRAAASSTSFPGLLDSLNHGLFTLRRQAEVQRTTPELEGIVDDLKSMYQVYRDDVVTAMRYILSNVILSNRKHNAPQLARLTQLQSVIRRFLWQQPSQPPQPEFHLLALMLFWPEEQLQEVQQEADDEEEGRAAEDDESSDEDTDEDQETEALLPLNLQQHVRSMKNAFEGTYAKYLRGRYLLPLFFLGKGHGLSKWIHKSILDAVVEGEVDSELTEQNDRKKKEMIDDMWCEGRVWQVQGIRELLLPVQVESQQTAAMQEVSVRVGGQEIQARLEVGPSQRSELFYLYFTIQGPVVINVSTPHDELQLNDCAVQPN